MHAVPEPLKSHLRVCSSTFSSAHDVRRVISEFVNAENKENFREMFESDPMEVDAMTSGYYGFAKGKGKDAKGKGKGKYYKDEKGKAKGKGKTYTPGQGGGQRAEDRDTCRFCGRHGHWQRDC